MDTIILADGTEIENAYLIHGNGRVFFYIEEGATMESACHLMSDSEKTSEITYNGETFIGFTDLFILQKTGNQISGGLAKE